MKQQYLSDAIAAIPPSTGATSVGNPSDGDPANGIDATAPGAYWFYQVMTELENVITEAGLTPDVDDLTQLRVAVNTLISNAGGLDTNAGDQRYMRRSQNLGDLNSASAARGNLGVLTAAEIQTRIGSAIDALVNGAPGALNTLNELADALGDDANFATTIMNSIAAKANISSPTFTGDPRVPAVPSNPNGRRIPTVEWTRALVGDQLFVSTDNAGRGMTVGGLDTGTLFTLSSSMAGYNFLRISYTYQPNTISITYNTSMIPVSRVPTARDTSEGFAVLAGNAGNVIFNGRVNMWGSGTALRLEVDGTTGMFVTSIWGVEPV